MPAVVSTPENFNAFETATAANAISGDIRTRVAGSGFTLDVVAISGGAQMASFSDVVKVELLGNAALGVALDAQNCPTSFTVLQSVAPDPAISAGRSSVAFAAVADSWRDVRVRVSYPAGAPTVSACSTDNFAIRPASFALSASDTDWENAGAGRALDNTGASGGTVHKAGRPFRLTVTPSPGTVGNYDGSPTLSALACSLPAPCLDGTLSLGAFSGAGARVSDSTYDEAGAFDLTLVDQDYASVDADDSPGDCSATGRFVCQSATAAIGRFVPDHFTIAPVIPPEFRTFGAADAACSPPGGSPARSFTYVGQPFGYTLAGVPQGTVQARNAAGNPTTNYRGALWKLAADDVTQTFTDASGLAITPNLGAATLSEIPNTGTGTFTATSADRIAFDRSSTTPSAPFNADIRLRWSVADAAEDGAGQGTIGTAPDLDFDSVAFDSGNEFRYGRLRIANVNGSQLARLPLTVEAQYWGYTNPPANTVLAFVTNAADHCTSIASANLAMSSFSGNLSPCETALSAAGPLTAGRRTLALAAPGSGNNGAVTLTANLGTAASGTTCVAVGGATVPANGAGQLHLQGNWTGADFDDNPAARVTFGAFRGSGQIIHMRENF
jgi:MSHA biogenesis protein MshQ